MKIDRTHTPENTNDGADRLNKLSYRDGLIHQGNLEDMLFPAQLSERAKTRTNKGVIVGVAIATILSLIGGATFFVTQSHHPASTQEQTAPVNP
ncbi:MAG TPA: hypothetical protein V6D50_18580 [Chroococcales cyanobacterium]|jgi:hypothetical protein